MLLNGGRRAEPQVSDPPMHIALAEYLPVIWKDVRPFAIAHDEVPQLEKLGHKVLPMLWCVRGEGDLRAFAYRGSTVRNTAGGETSENIHISVREVRSTIHGLIPL